jgi:hypothetical protein
MLLLTNTRIKQFEPPARRVPADQPFQPGEVFMIRYMAMPTVVTVVARRDGVVETDLVTVAVDRFDQCVLFRMGRRRRILGVWLPWLSCAPERVIHLALGDDSAGMDQNFWRGRQCSLAVMQEPVAAASSSGRCDDGPPVARASVMLFQRYQGILATAPSFTTEPDGCSRAHLLWMCATAIEQAPAWPVDKTSRWLGFVQGVMTLRGLLTVSGEREFSRPLFHTAYAEQGQAAPASMGKTI